MGKSLTFGRWEKAAGNENAGTGPTESPGPIAHLRKVSRKHGKITHLRKVGEGNWKRKRGYRPYRVLRTIAHLRKVSRKRGDTTHLRKVGRGGWRRKRAYRPYRESRADSFRRCREMAGKCDSFRRSVTLLSQNHYFCILNNKKR